jgi:hypothetical protein
MLLVKRPAFDTLPYTDLRLYSGHGEFSIAIDSLDASPCHLKSQKSFPTKRIKAHGRKPSLGLLHCREARNNHIC